MGHGIAGVDREVEDRVLELMGVGQRRAELPAPDRSPA